MNIIQTCLECWPLKLHINIQDNVKCTNCYLFPPSGGGGTSGSFSFSLLLSRFFPDGVLDRDLLPFGDFSLGDLDLFPFGDLGDFDLGLSDFPVPGRSSGTGV